MASQTFSTHITPSPHHHPISRQRLLSVSLRGFAHLQKGLLQGSCQKLQAGLGSSDSFQDGGLQPMQTAEQSRAGLLLPRLPSIHASTVGSLSVLQGQ